jgi:hypothetical protein
MKKMILEILLKTL